MPPRGTSHRRPPRAIPVALAAAAIACATPPPSREPGIDAEIYRRAETHRAELLERELTRLRADLRRAEETLVAVESGLRSRQGRADAVSALAQAHIEVERAAQQGPWRGAEIAEARSKLDEADAQIREGHFGAGLFFVYRASRLAALVSEEARQVRELPGASFVDGSRVNLRAGPSTNDQVVAVLTRGTPVFAEAEEAGWVLVRTTAGPVGWIHRDLLRPPEPP